MVHSLLLHHLNALFTNTVEGLARLVENLDGGSRAPRRRRSCRSNSIAFSAGSNGPPSPTCVMNTHNWPNNATTAPIRLTRRQGAQLSSSSSSSSSRGARRARSRCPTRHGAGGGNTGAGGGASAGASHGGAGGAPSCSARAATPYRWGKQPGGTRAHSASALYAKYKAAAAAAAAATGADFGLAAIPEHAVVGAGGSRGEHVVTGATVKRRLSFRSRNGGGVEGGVERPTRRVRFAAEVQLVS